MTIHEWKETVLKVEGVYLSDTPELIKRKLLEIEEAAVKHFETAHTENYTAVMEMFFEYAKKCKMPINEVLDIFEYFRKFETRIQKYIPEECSEAIHASFDEYMDQFFGEIESTFAPHNKNVFLPDFGMSDDALDIDSIIDHCEAGMRLCKIGAEISKQKLSHYSSPLAIHSVSEFLTTFKPGDKFWHLTGIDGQPIDVVGPITITSINSNELGDRVYGLLDEGSGKQILTENYISDLTNYYNGVCATKENASMYLEERTKHLSQEKKTALLKESKEVDKKIHDLENIVRMHRTKK